MLNQNWMFKYIIIFLIPFETAKKRLTFAFQLIILIVIY